VAEDKTSLRLRVSGSSSERNIRDSKPGLPKISLIQLGESGTDQIVHQLFIDFPIDRDLKAVLEDDKSLQPKLEVSNDTRTPGRKCEVMLVGGKANHILSFPVDGRNVPGDFGFQFRKLGKNEIDD
jgi:hypothetical protein